MTARDTGRSRTVLGLLIFASITLITLDGTRGDESLLAPIRTVAANALGPAESAVATALRPITALPDRFRTVADLQERNNQLESENARLLARVRANDLVGQRGEEFDGLIDIANRQGFEIVPAQVVGFGPAQSFGLTVTIDAGTRDGVDSDMTVLNDTGLVGRVVSADTFTSTVLLIVDAESVVGGRVSSSRELGFLDGGGSLNADGTLSMSLVDQTAVPQTGDTVVSWGSPNGAPYVPAVPIGRVVSVQHSPRELSSIATIQPAVDFSSLDLIGVVIGSDPRASRPPLNIQQDRQATGR